MTGHIRRPAALITAWLLLTALARAGQRTAPATYVPDRDFLPAGPFLIPPGATRPVYMDALRARPIVKSPDAKAQITVTGPSESLKAWVTLQLLGRYAKGLEYQVWPIQRDVDVLWRPDGQAFALTDNRYANRSYVLVCGTNFRMGEDGLGLGIPITDLTPIVEKAFRKRAQKYYAHRAYYLNLCYVKTLRWVDNDHLLVGVSAMTSAQASSRERGIKDWDAAYVVDVPGREVVAELSGSQLLTEYGIRVAHE